MSVLRKVSVVLAAGLLAGVMAPAQAGLISSVLSANADNTFEDLSREAYVDANHDGLFDTGDVLTGFVQIEKKTSPNGINTPNQIYAIFSIQVAGIGTPACPNCVLFAPTTTAGLTLSTLVPGAGATDMVAVFDRTAGFSVDLITASPGDRTGNGTTTLADYFNLIETEGTLELTAGPTNVGDFFTSSLSVTPGAFTTAFIAALPNTAGVGSTTAALGANVNNLGVTLVPDTGPALNPAIPAFINDQVEISKGAIAGASGAVNAPEWTSAQEFVSGLQCGAPGGPQTTGCGFTDNATIIIHPVPEPGSLLLLGVALLATGGVGTLRKKK
jgi:hypothetical protein